MLRVRLSLQGNPLVKRFMGLLRALEDREEQGISKPVDPMPLRQALQLKYPLRKL